MAEDVSGMETTAVTDSGLFVRNATGLVRGMSQRASVALNFIPGHPTQTLSAVLFYFITVFAGANMYLALETLDPAHLQPGPGSEPRAGTTGQDESRHPDAQWDDEEHPDEPEPSADPQDPPDEPGS